MEGIMATNLTIGAWCNKVPGTIGIGLQPGPACDVIMDAKDLRYPDKSVDNIYSFDMVEHVYTKDVSVLFKEWYRVLVPGGRLEIGTIELEALCRQFLNAKFDERKALINHFYGSHSFDSDIHHTGFDFDLLKFYLEEAGFTGVKRYDTQYKWSGSLVVEAFKGNKKLKDKGEQMDIFNQDIRTKELALYFNTSQEDIKQELSKGFLHFHKAIADDWNVSSPVTQAHISEWYSKTNGYIWELHTYHLADYGFGDQFKGSCETIDSLMQSYKGCGAKVLELGGGIGDLSLFLNDKGWDITYYDIPGKTMEFALFNYVYWKSHYNGNLNLKFIASDGNPTSIIDNYDIIVATDFFEHLPGVEAYVKKCFDILTPNGILIAFNAFGEGSVSNSGTIPQHLVVNDKYVTEFVPLMKQIGFENIASNVYKKPA